MNEVMKEYLLKKPLGKNFVDELTDALVDTMRYSDNESVYPDIEAAKVDDGVVAEWFYPAINGANGYSELSAILQYTTQESMFEEIGELMLGIGLTEMKHYGKLSDFVVKLGGNLSQVYTTHPTVYKAKNVSEALDNAIESERLTIEKYNDLKEKIEGVEETVTTKIALQLISKILSDEELHIKLLTDRKSSLENVE